MLSQTQLKTLAENSGLTADVLAKAISDEQEAIIEMPIGRFLTTENEATLLDNHGKKRYDAGVSKTQKDAFDGKTKEVFISDLEKSILDNANIEPNEKLTEIKNSLNLLQDKYNTDIQAKDAIISDKENMLSNIQRQSKIQGLLPELKEGITNDVAITMFNATHEVKEDGIYKNGQLLKNDLQANLSLEESLNAFITDRDWKKPELAGHGGKGNPDFSLAKPKNYEEFEKYCESKNIQLGGQEANKLIETFAKDNPTFFN